MTEAATQPTPASPVELSGERMRLAWSFRSNDESPLGIDFIQEFEFLSGQILVDNGDDRAADELMHFAKVSNSISLAKGVGLRVVERILSAQALVLSATAKRWSEAFLRIQDQPPFG